MRRTTLMSGLLGIALAAAAFGAEPVKKDNGLISWWKFDEGSGTVVNDSAGRNKGSVSGAVWAKGEYGTALSFNGKDGFVYIPDAANLNPAQITLEMWIKFNDIPYRGVALSKEGQYRLLAPDIGARMVLSLRYATAGTDWVHGMMMGESLLAPGVWYHIAVTYDVHRWSMYRNGNPDGEKEESGPLKTGANGIVIGALGGKTLTFDGLIHEVKIWDRARSGEEIRAAYEAGRRIHQ